MSVPNKKPIIFSEDMVNAILCGRKTQTRRIVKGAEHVERWDTINTRIRCWAGRWSDGNGMWSDYRSSPYLDIGFQLWVREAFLYCKGSSEKADHNDATYVCFRDGGQIHRMSGEYHPWNLPEPPVQDRWPSWVKWKSPIHMPRWASRITLEITDLRIERLQDITDSDIEAEGIHLDFTAEPKPKQKQSSIRRYYFRQLWDKLNSKRGFPWESNPWVWAITFKVIQPTTKP